MSCLIDLWVRGDQELWRRLRTSSRVDKLLHRSPGRITVDEGSHGNETAISVISAECNLTLSSPPSPRPQSERGRNVARKLIEKADVFVENYVPGKLEKFGLGYEQLNSINPRLVYCSITGYGSTGPYAKSPGYDVVIEAEAGFMHITGEKSGQPVKTFKVGVAVTDIIAGHYAQSGILAALLKRARTGKGSHVECSLFESQIASLANIGSNYLISGIEATRMGTSHPSIVPYQVFPTKDSFLMLSAGNDTQFKLLCSPEIFDREAWPMDIRFRANRARVENRVEMIRLIEEVLAGKTTAEWCEKLMGKGLPFAPINNIAQTFAHPQAIARHVVEEVDVSLFPWDSRHELIEGGAITSIQEPGGSNWRLLRSRMMDQNQRHAYRPPPYLGQHTREILTEIGYEDSVIVQLEKDGVL
ncbi:hypothetical protein P7C73_g344, partial [Tremellales sp. Uapishka_1]